jgi:hypothetical protein
MFGPSIRVGAIFSFTCSTLISLPVFNNYADVTDESVLPAVFTPETVNVDSPSGSFAVSNLSITVPSGSLYAGTENDKTI